MGWTEFRADDICGHARGDGGELAVVLHGGPGLSDYTEGLADEIFDAGDGAFRVVRYEQRTTEPLTVAQLVDDLRAVVDHFGAARALIVGHSWGSHLAMHFAVAHPGRVRALVLVDSLGAIGDGGTGTMGAVIGSRIGPDAVAQLEALPARGLSAADAGLEQLRLIWPGYFSDPSAAPPLPPIAYDTDAGGAIMGDAARFLGEGFLERELPSLDIPSLHLIARHSPIDPAANERTAALMREAVVEFTDTGHFPWIEQRGTIAAAVRRFLAETS
jgi:proline iminopeptidase